MIWTKPDDWDVEPNADLKQSSATIPREPTSASPTARCTSSRTRIDPKTLQKLVTRDGGEVIGSDEF